MDAFLWMIVVAIVIMVVIAIVGVSLYLVLATTNLVVKVTSTLLAQHKAKKESQGRDSDCPCPSSEDTGHLSDSTLSGFVRTLASEGLAAKGASMTHKEVRDVHRPCDKAV